MPSLHRLSDNRRLSVDEYGGIRRGLDQIEQLHAAHRRTVVEHGLDPEVFLPGNIWAQIYDLDSFHTWTYDLVNMVKCLSPLTGFDMFAWEQRVGDPRKYSQLDRFHGQLLQAGAMPLDIDELLEREFHQTSRLEGSFYLFDAHDALLRHVPDRYVAVCPDRMGEIGVVGDDGRLVNPDLLTYQARINAMVGAGVLEMLDRTVRERGSANVMEIGPGLCFVPWTLQRAFEGRLNVFLVDLPRVMANGYAYLSGVAGTDAAGLIESHDQPVPSTPFVFVPNYLLPSCERDLPPFDLVINAISLNEMNAKQISYYLAFIDRHLAPEGVFFLEQGAKYLDEHEDAWRAACERFPKHCCYRDTQIGGVTVTATPNTFFYANAR